MKFSSKLFGGNHLSHLIGEDINKFIKHFYEETSIVLPEAKVSNSVSLNSSNLNKLQNGHFALAIPDDLSIFVYFTIFEGKKLAFIICRKLEEGYSTPKILVMNVDVNNDDIFKGTLFECTRIRVIEKNKNDARYFILISDVLFFCGKNIEKDLFLKRLECACIFLDEYYKENFKKFPFRMQICTIYDRLRLIEQRISNLPYKIKYITFVSQNARTAKLIHSIEV
ncbi:hypothetical protein JO84_gp262 [Aureococcus anophagefferens virus]|uniref:Uncharacterized protein n=1 Tax=Aureococcus anophagefferens virus TaxID=1474867 RepID=A0A076FH57_9VIRU|nr:hypothetical protein JO84_gp262 [Aureococcus anophagefferens virus]AII17082.1 hypothetical protein AaV_213 [Aureococcus anophagefferens virus]UOG94127.1 hypothetical protein MKD35_86 [Aureococcus anophagefferens virus]